MKEKGFAKIMLICLAIIVIIVISVVIFINGKNNKENRENRESNNTNIKQNNSNYEPQFDEDGTEIPPVQNGSLTAPGEGSHQVMSE